MQQPKPNKTNMYMESKAAEMQRIQMHRKKGIIYKAA